MLGDSGLASIAEMRSAHLSSPDMQAMRYHLKVDIKYIDGLLRSPVVTCSWRRGLDNLPRFQLCFHQTAPRRKAL
jgi:hypothetical protein